MWRSERHWASEDKGHVEVSFDIRLLSVCVCVCVCVCMCVCVCVCVYVVGCLKVS